MQSGGGGGGFYGSGRNLFSSGADRDPGRSQNTFLL